jgi:nucleoside 2-deoxyribosyltransferase
MMRFRSAALDKIASFICGDSPLPFPYRSSSRLTGFFTGLDLDFIHNGETRNTWTRDVLIEISRKTGKVSIYSSAEDALFAVVLELMNPVSFEGHSKVDFEQALLLINKTLMPYDLEVVFDKKKSKCDLRSTGGKFISTAHRTPDKATKIMFSPRVFEVPEEVELQENLVAIMMPFGGFDLVDKAIRTACLSLEFEPKRADDIWENSTILQDIFDLIYSAEIVVADFTGKNPNVMYETGIAHTLGKHVIPITQTLEHVPSNLHGHRALLYVGANSQGLVKLTADLTDRLRTIKEGKRFRS